LLLLLLLLNEHSRTSFGLLCASKINGIPISPADYPLFASKLAFSLAPAAVPRITGVLCAIHTSLIINMPLIGGGPSSFNGPKCLIEFICRPFLANQ